FMPAVDQGLRSQPALGVAAILAKPFAQSALQAYQGTQQAMTGQLGEPGTRAFTENALPTAGAYTTLGMTAGMPMAEAGGAGIFGGRLARTADHAALARAEQMAKDGA